MGTLNVEILMEVLSLLRRIPQLLMKQILAMCQVQAMYIQEQQEIIQAHKT